GGLEHLKPGDVLMRRGAKAVVLQRTRGRGGDVKVLALTPDRGVVRLGAGDLAPGGEEPVGAIELPRPYAPRSPAFRRAVSESLRTMRPRPGTRDAPAAPEGDGRDAAQKHPVASCPDLAGHLRYAERADRLARDADRLERRIRGRAESLARLFDRVLRVLEAWGYIDGWALTDAGELLSRLYTETDLLVAESMRDGLLDGLDPPSLAAVCSAFTFESRGPGSEEAGVARARYPNRRVRDRMLEIDRIWRDLNTVEEEAGLPETRPVDGGFARPAHAWASGQELEEVLADDELTGGDFVRNVKQLIDLLRQVGDVAPVPETATAARSAADALFRGVVAASTAVGV
ncbi:MAG: DEAD/DEAH box helicase, partial [Acidimicrobiia bacterium]